MAQSTFLCGLAWRLETDSTTGKDYICWRLKLEGETENMGVCTKEREGIAAEVLMATPCTGR